MLKLQRLEVSGFKSFVDPVEVRFAGGVTGIVGPNGCGKSNLSDAITWVLGEQSAKSMRADTMEDVIFNGSEKRKPLGLAEVTLTFQAEPGFLGSDDGRVTISRRVFRSGESQYRLNGKVTRLKDVKDLLMDTGLGVRAYSVIEQGKIGLILSGKPQERRRLLEEAAGITRYKARKKIAEVKLEEATQNLLRLDDILSEVERNLRSLKRQAGAARRYTEKRAELQGLEETVLLGRWAAISRDLAARRQALGDAQARETEIAATIHRGEADLAALREQVERLAGELAERNRRQAELAGVIEGRQQLAAGARRTISEIDARLAGGVALAGRLARELEGHAAGLAELAERRQGLISEHDEAARLVEADGARLREVERSTADGETRLDQIRAELLASLGRLNELRERIHREQIESEKGTFRQRHLLDELAQRGQELAEASAALDAARARSAELEGQVAAHEAELEAARAGLERLLADESRAAETLRALERERAVTAERQRFLAEVAARAADEERALVERLAEIGLGDAPRLGSRIHALRGWERSLDLYLGALVDAVLVSDGAAAIAGARALGERGRAGASFLAPRPDAVERLAADDGAIVASLGEALGLAPELAAALPPAFLVERAEDAERLARRFPGAAFLSRERVWAEGGLVHLAGEQAQPGLLERSSELAEMAERLPRLEADVETARAEVGRLVGERSAAAEIVRRLEGELTAFRQELAVSRSRRDELEGRHRRLSEARATLDRERQSLEGDLARRLEAQRSAAEELARLEQVHAGHEQVFDRVQSEVDSARAEREQVRALGAGRRGQLDVLTERLRSLEQQATRLERESDAARHQIGAWEQESEGLSTRRGELEATIATAERELGEALELRAGGEELVRTEETRLDEERQRVRQADAALAAERDRHDGARRDVEELRIALTGLEHDGAHLATEYRERRGGELPETPGEVPPNLAELEVDLARLRDQLESIGPVNVLAAEEYGAEEERHKFLTEQRGDVGRSVESLRQTIREINQTSSERFRETFNAVNEQFSKTFVELFRGGEAEMRLMDEEDLLECGIEIVARPPGKRLQNLMLLSGGEKALTAIALLFALFRIKPSPFCILDEVDAPLDDVNTLRFVGMLRQLSQETQCLVITHNKLTMEVAATLYGVTMEERGVSKLVAVELEDVQPEAATA
ncbi:MAG: chromosome partition protein Smc [Acidobacteriota bacterium]